MARSLTLKNLPDDLHGRLKQAAQQHRRSLPTEAAFAPDHIDAFKREGRP